MTVVWVVSGWDHDRFHCDIYIDRHTHVDVCDERLGINIKH